MALPFCSVVVWFGWHSTAEPFGDASNLTNSAMHLAARFHSACHRARVRTVNISLHAYRRLYAARPSTPGMPASRRPGSARRLLELAVYSSYAGCSVYPDCGAV